MSLKEMPGAGAIIFMFRYCRRCCQRLRQGSGFIYQDSQIYRLIEQLREKIKIYFRYSFWGRISELKQTKPINLNNSLVIQYLTNSYKKLEDKKDNYLRTSLIAALLEDANKKFYSSPLRVMSTIVVAVVLVNIVLSIALQRQIGLWGWIIRISFLFLGIEGLFCTADWTVLKNNSLFFRLIGKIIHR